MTVKPLWDREGRDWPHRQASRFIEAAGLKWHVQVMGRGPPVLLLHGSGAASHSWRDLVPGLAERFTLVIPDLPGHGFTATPGSDGLSLQGMAAGVAALTHALGLEGWAAVGHSAGAAVAIQMRRDGAIGEGGVVSINGALKPFLGSGGHILPAMARLLFLSPPATALFAWRAGRPGAVARLMEGTGSRLDERGLDLYRRLFCTTGHVAGALGMMANWNLQPLVAALPRTRPPLTLIVAGNDRAVPPAIGRQAQALIPGSRLVTVPGLGHLAHEEDPMRFSSLILEALDLAAGGAEREEAGVRGVPCQAARQG